MTVTSKSDLGETSCATIGRFSAAADGIAISAYPDGGYSGVSASAWAVWDNELKCEVCRDAKPSKDANRNQWAARIRAIKGALETEKVPHGACIDVIAELKATELLARVLDGKRTKADGRTLLVDLDLWDEVREVIRLKGLHVIPNLSRTGVGVGLLPSLRGLARRTASMRRAEIGPEREAQTALPPKRNSRKPPPFPPIED